MELLQDLPNSEFKTFSENSKSFVRRNGLRKLKRQFMSVDAWPRRPKVFCGLGESGIGLELKSGKSRGIS
jgi:hypothetical protein